MGKKPNIYFAFLILIISATIFVGSLYNYNLSKVSNDDTLKEVVIEQGSISSIAETLKEEDLIRNVFVFKVYTYISGNTNLKAATYMLSEDMGTKKIVEILSGNGGISSSDIKITFKEGIDVVDIARIIEENTNNSKEDVLGVLEDKDYLKELISEYWFLTDEILNDKIYYSLEGYLYPNTYLFSGRDVSVKEIFETMLDDMEKKLNEYKDEINNSALSVHDLLTLASMVELEASNEEDRKGVAGVFYNRLDIDMTLGSDVTTYYGARVDMADRGLYTSELNECNDYNTRCSSFGGLPVSPICNPSIESIEATINPDDNDYYYFVADVNKKVHFSKTSSEQSNTIYRLKRDGLWPEY